MILVFIMLSFKSVILLSYFTFIKRLFSSSWLSAIRVVTNGIKWRGTKEPLDEGERRMKSWLKVNIQKTMAKRRGRSGKSDGFYFLGLQNHREQWLWNEQIYPQMWSRGPRIMRPSDPHHFMANRGGKWKQRQGFFSWLPKSLLMVTAAKKLKDTCSLKGKL